MSRETKQKPEMTLLGKPEAEDVIALFERISGRKATAEERQGVEKILAERGDNER
jgi:hypothetical protein